MKKIILFSLLITAPAFAEDKEEVPVKVFDFEQAEEIDGAALKPLEMNIWAMPHNKTPSLIRIRKDFTDELMKSVEDI